MSAASDEAHLESAVEHSRIFVTSDSDYGNLVFVRGLGAGVIYLRVRPSTIAATHRELERVLTLYAMDDMLGAFIVIEPGRHRKRIAPGESQSAEN